jgi:protein involved in polysaccharide export with SLBB domain
LERLRNLKPDGRVVLDIKPDAMSIAEMPPLELVDGDVVSIPAVPGQIVVFGSVYSQGAYAFEPGNTVFDYLGMAGGAAKSSDKSSIFVIRANGKVDSAQQGWVPFVSGLYGKRALPGDAIYVPEDFERVSLTKTLLDYSQILFQIGLGAASVNAIKD